LQFDERKAVDLCNYQEDTNFEKAELKRFAAQDQVKNKLQPFIS